MLDRVYRENIPTIKSTIEWKVDTPPYQTKINNHKSLVCHIDGESLASAYQTYGEKLLQQNIRNSEGMTPQNLDIYNTAVSNESENFYFYNNGITVVCDAWDYDQPSWRLSLTRPQIVNGGQTLRQIAAAQSDNKLRKEVKVLLRVISIGDNKEFAGNVAVNLNNQTVVKSSFLKSNHPFFIQMQHALLPMGWYLERKQGDWENLTETERADLLAKICSEDQIIQMQTGCQAYCSVYLQDIDLAKKNPKLIFLPKRSGGRFEDIATSHFTPSRLVSAYSILQAVENSIKSIRQLRLESTQTQKSQLKKILGTDAHVKFEEVRPMVSQAALFTSGLVAHQLGEDYEAIQKMDQLDKLIGKALYKTLITGEKREGSWATLLKSQSFYEEVKKQLRIFPTKKVPTKKVVAKKVIAKKVATKKAAPTSHSRK
ncbi:AIPR family protein [Cupriavidus sp. USMAHM13]|uniref:AIPR family protein n=1 Tax=Cupriavidus sp. USMAHM13 TaxID=1389192 RepID=UPI0012EACE8D|nr:AIPR family protein [Cupriavidus sp. USMAHM13]